VTRVEFQLRQPAIKQFGSLDIRTMVDSASGIWAHLTEEWLSLRVASSDLNKSRWIVDPRWRAIANAPLRHDAVALSRLTEVEHARRVETLLPGLRGYLTQFGALVGVAEFKEVAHRVERHLRRQDIARGSSFEDEVRGKALSLGVG